VNSPRLPHFTDFVGGLPVAADRSGTAIDLIAPQTGQTIGMIAESGNSGVDRAVAAASAAFAATRRQPTHQRIAWLNTAAQALAKANDEIAALICEDVGKPIRMARFEVRRGAEFLELTAAALTQLGGDAAPGYHRSGRGSYRLCPACALRRRRRHHAVQRAGQSAGSESGPRHCRRQCHDRQAGASGHQDGVATRAAIP
jgi:hypothetical protein